MTVDYHDRPSLGMASNSTEHGYRAAVLASHPILYWPLDEQAGSTTCVDIILGRAAGVNPTTQLAVPNPWGRNAASRQDGSTTSGVTETSPRARSGALSVECWYRTANAQGTMMELNATQTGIGGGTYNPSLYLQAGILRGFVFGTSANQINDTVVSNDGLWHHAALTYDNFGSMLLFRDGVQVATFAPTIPSQAATASYWHLGAGWRGVAMTGDVCHCAIYDRALSPAEISGHYTATDPPPKPPDPTPDPNACIRKAWLALPDGRTLGLEGPGWFCQKLDLGSPTIRDVVNNRPDNDGTVDRTRYMGSRAVEADITTLVGAGARVDEVASSFAPYMNPAVRPVLHYVLDRLDNPERTLTLRCTAYSWPIIGDNQRDIQLQWVAPDPVVRGAVTNLATAWSGSGSVGRTYTRIYPRLYPAGSASPVSGRIVSPGDLSVRPYLRIYGPITAPAVTFVPDLTSGDIRTWGQVLFVSNFTIGAGHFVGVDTDAHTAFLDDDPTQPVLSQLDWNHLQWPVLSPKPNGWTMSLTGLPAMSGATQVQATWQDRYLS